MRFLLCALALIASALACPEKCKCEDSVVDCTGAGYRSIPDKLPDGTHSLIFSNNKLSKLTIGDARKIRKIENLTIRNNSLTEIEENIFDELPNLRRIFLSYNQLRNLPRLASRSNQVICVDIRHNYVNHIHQEAFKFSPHLRRLDVASNNLQTLASDIFENNNKLTHLIMYDNLWNCDCRMRKIKEKLLKEPKIIQPVCITPFKLEGVKLSNVNEERLMCEEPTRSAEGTRSILKCPIDLGDGDRIVWLQDNIEITKFNETSYVNNEGWLISNMPVENVQCTVDKIANSLIRELRQIRVHHGKAPIISYRQQPTSARDGDVVELICEATGDPTPKVQWFFGNEEIIESKKYKLAKASTVFRIHPFLETDVGSYLCKASNIHGATSHTIMVSLIQSEPPKIFDAPMTQMADIGQQLTLRCNAKGVPNPEIAWLFEGVRIPRKNTRYTISEDNIELTIEKLTRHDSGTYTCQAVNSVGSDTASAVLTIGAAFTRKIDEFLTEGAVEKIVNQARKSIEQSLSISKTEKERMKAMRDPNDLRSLFRISAPLKKMDLGKAREIYEESIRLMQDHINSGLSFTAAQIAPNVSYEAILPVSYVQTLMEKSGCQTGQFVESCEDFCFYSKYRSYDGQCNNYEHPMWGVSEMSFIRLLPPRYENGFNTPVGWEKGKLYNGHVLPNPRKISRQLIGTDEITPHGHLSAMVMQWGQFMDHDMTLTAPALTRHSYREGAFCNRTCDNVDPCFNIQLEQDDPKLHTGLTIKYPCIEFERNGAACGSGETSPIFQRVTYRDQLNVLTSYLDASGVYGNSEEQSLELRDLYSDHGLLRFDIVSEAQKPYLPFEKDSDMDCRRNFSRENPIRCFLAGDIRANEQLGLTTLHTLFLREHNRIASKFLELNVNWDGETIFQETRKLIGAMIQHVTYNDWLPKLLGKGGYRELIGDYKGYDPDVNPTVSNEFASAALRFAHTLINPQLYRFDKDFKPIKEGHLSLHKAFFAPERLLAEGGVDPLLRGLFAAPIKLPRPNQLLNKELTEKLFNRFHEVALDLAAMNIQRGRDHGLPSWTEYRKFCNLTEPKSWGEMMPIVKNQTVIMKLQQLYGVPQNIDLWVGGITEQKLPDGLLGPTFACIISDQFRRLRSGDRFWYENEGMFTKLQLRQIKKASLAKIVCTNGDMIPRIQRDVFTYHGNTTDFFEACEELPEVNLNMWSACCDNNCSGESSRKSSEPSMASEFRKRRSHKHCTVDGQVREHEERWTTHDDKCVQCSCQNGEVWCRSVCKN